jgi:prophage antirepressor-like protein
MDILEAFIENNSLQVKNYNNENLYNLSEITDLLHIKDIEKCIDNKYIKKIIESGMQDVTFLTEAGLYKLLMVSRKPIAEKFQEWIEDILISIRETGKYELDLNNQTIQEAIKKEAEKYKLSNEQANHDALTSSYANKPVVYFGKIKNIDNKILIKIGATIDTKTREEELKKDFGSMTFFKIIDCPVNETFEKFLHKHPYINQFMYKDKVYEDKLSHEVFLVTEEECAKIINIANHNIYKFRNQLDINIEHLIELEKIKLQQLEFKSKTDDDESSSDDEDEDMKQKIYCYENGLVANYRNHTQVRGDKIQIYNPETKELVKTYDCLVAVTRERDYMQDASRNMILNAIKNNTIYKNYRWLKLTRDLSDDTIQELSETVKSVCVNNGFVAMLKLDKSRIEKVFCDQIAASEDRQFKTGAAICKAIKCGTQSGGHYFKMWFDCDEQLKNEYLSREQLPSKRKTVNSISIQKLNPITKTLIKEYMSMEEVIKEYKIGRATIKKASESDYIICGFKWKIIT